MRKLVPIIVVIAALMLGIWVGWKRPRTEPLGPALRIDFIDVGQGDSILIQTPDGANALIDAGEEGYGPAVADHLRSAGVRRLDLVVMTHPHRDHIGGIPAVLQAVPAARVLDSGYACGSTTQENVLKVIGAGRIPYTRAKVGMAITLGTRARLEVLSPQQQLAYGTRSDADNSSIVIRLVFGQVRVLLMGDAQEEAEGALIASHRNLESQILKIAHHGADDATSLELLRLVKPDYVVISVGARGEDGSPGRRVLRRLDKERTGAELFRTDRDGTVSFLTDGRRIIVEKER